MNTLRQRSRVNALVLLVGAGVGAMLSGCLADGGVGYAGGVYEPGGYGYGGWGRGYYVAPSRGGERREARVAPHAYRAAPSSRPAPSIPSRRR